MGFAWDIYRVPLAHVLQISRGGDLHEILDGFIRYEMGNYFFSYYVKINIVV